MTDLSRNAQRDPRSLDIIQELGSGRHIGGFNDLTDHFTDSLLVGSRLMNLEQEPLGEDDPSTVVS